MRNIGPTLIIPFVLLLVGAGCDWNSLTDDEQSSVRWALNATPPPEPVQVVMIYDDLAEMTPDEIRALGSVTVMTLTLGGDVFPFPSEQFNWEEQDACKTEHYHGTSGLTIDLKTVKEPAEDCGFGNDVQPKKLEAEKLLQWFWERAKLQGKNAAP